MGHNGEFGSACCWVEENADQIDALPDLGAPPYPWTDAYASEDLRKPIDRFSPLDMAIIAGRRDIVEKLIRRGARTDALERLMEWARWEPEDVRAILALLPDYRPGFDRMSSAIRRRDATELETLIDQGGDPNRQRADRSNDDGTPAENETLLEVAARDGDPACAALLIQRGAVIRPEAMERAVARESGAAAMANLLLGAGAILPEHLVHGANSRGETPLWRAVNPDRNRRHDTPAADRYALAALLIEHGAEVNAAASDGTTPLWIVCSSTRFAPQEDRLPLAALLIEHGADVNAATRDNGTTPLMFVSATGEQNLIALLLKSGADPRARDSEGRTAVDFARMRGRDKAAEMLVFAAGDTGQD